MAQNFLACDREQELLLPPSLREWLPEEHLAWFVIDAIAEMDLLAFYGAYRQDGHGRAVEFPRFGGHPDLRTGGTPNPSRGIRSREHNRTARSSPRWIAR